MGAADPAPKWRSASVAAWYGTGDRGLEIVSDTAVWSPSGRPPVPLRGVLLRDPLEQCAPQALLGTGLDAAPRPVLAWVVQRWHLGVETHRQWSEPAIRRPTPTLLGLVSLVTLAAPEERAGRPGPVARAAW